jgi:curved DNA-binding protein CbpA
VRRDPYRVLGVPPTATSEELHDAYRRLIKLHHPDRNGGSAESTARFQEIQAAWEDIRSRPRAASAARASSESVEERMAKLEGEVRVAQRERERVREAARKALRDLEPEPEPEAPAEEDSLSAILFDIVDEIGERLAGPRRHVRGVDDLIDGLDDLASRLDRKG